MYITENPDVPCKQGDPELWFARPNSHRAARARAICRQLCPERTECLASTIRFEIRENTTQTGVFGGMNEAERQELRRRKTRTQAAASA